MPGTNTTWHCPCRRGHCCCLTSTMPLLQLLQGQPDCSRQAPPLSASPHPEAPESSPAFPTSPELWSGDSYPGPIQSGARSDLPVTPRSCKAVVSTAVSSCHVYCYRLGWWRSGSNFPLCFAAFKRNRKKWAQEEGARTDLMQRRADRPKEGQRARGAFGCGQHWVGWCPSNHILLQLYFSK